MELCLNNGRYFGRKISSMDKKITAFDLDGTLTQHKTPLSVVARNALNMLREHFGLVMVGAGDFMRIYNQLQHYPIDVIGNYGIQIGKNHSEDNSMSVVSAGPFYPDKEGIISRAQEIRQKYGYTDYASDSIEVYDSGVITFALPGTKAAQSDKIKFDPYRRI